MIRPTRLLAGLAAAAVGAAVLAPSAGSAAPVASERDLGIRTSSDSAAPAGTRAIGLQLGGALVSFSLDNPRDVRRLGPVTGLGESDNSLVGMDYRPSNGRLYAVGDGGGVYVVNVRDQSLTFVGALTIPLNGEEFGVDFNPAADALRIVSDAGQNLRVTFTGIEVATTFADGNLNDGAAPLPNPVTGVAGAAYTNNDNSTVTGTNLLDINATADTLAVQAPANQGSLSPIGSLRTDIGPDVSFDVYSATNADGVTTDNAGYAVGQVEATRVLFRVNLTTGEATEVGAFRNFQRVGDLAVRLPSTTTPVPQD